MDAIELLTETKAVRRRIDFDRSVPYAVTWTTLHLGNADRVAEILNLPSDFAQAVILAVGYFKGDTFEPTKRLPVSSSIHRNGW